VDALTNENEPVFAEIIIEKKLRRSLLGNNENVVLYEIVNTKLSL